MTPAASPEPSTATKLLLTSLSAVAAESVTFPIDITKTRLQLHHHNPSSSSSSSPSALRVAADILLNEGVRGLYRGLNPAIVRHLFYTPIRIVTYEGLRAAAVGRSDGEGPSPLSVPAKAVIGGLSGVIAQVVASPADLVKVRLQADGHFVSQGLRRRYSGPIDVLKKTIHVDGVRGLWRGLFPNVQRAFLVNMGELACYDQAKIYVIGSGIADDNIYAHTLASIMSGLAATTLSCPADVVKTRMMSQAASEEGRLRYRNSFDCLLKTVRCEGAGALWKGFFPTWARLGPWQFVFWVSYEKFRQLAGFSPF